MKHPIQRPASRRRSTLASSITHILTGGALLLGYVIAWIVIISLILVGGGATVLALIFGGIGFIAALLLIATLMLTIKPKGRSSADLHKREGFEP